MADMSTYGVFKEEMNLAATGDPYDKPFAPDSRHTGKQFSVPDCTAVSGRGRDSWLDKSLQLATPSDPYRDPVDLPTIVLPRQAGPEPGAEGGPPRISDKPFRPSHPSVKS
ncbi:hypothetical protein GPECTOR_171g193 [Gonium pectorale]|uniref:Uncharacterized protein n=1 Tax=Gonium pectorale TaxID=33097 RepID=A0A150FXG5_GONPE|nr:hypothetical protein GPECTOR_171g193 [Gonium pectorale]|eukprot:KXZ42267.1 hypothetical protein GPECTOR_171g193 [Gonium pectorale]